MVRVQVASNEAEGGRFIGRAFNLARGEGAGGIAIGEQAEEELGGVGSTAARVIAGIQRREIQLGNHIDDEAGEMVRRQQVTQADSLVESGPVINGFEGSTHDVSVALPARSGEVFSPTNC